MDLGLKGKAAIVTGGSLGIGTAMALKLARDGADVAVNYRASATAGWSSSVSSRAVHQPRTAWQASSATM